MEVFSHLFLGWFSSPPELRKVVALRGPLLVQFWSLEDHHITTALTLLKHVYKIKKKMLKAEHDSRKPIRYLSPSILQQHQNK